MLQGWGPRCSDGLLWLVWCEKPASLSSSLILSAQSTSGAAFSLLWSVVDFSWLSREEHFIEDGKISRPVQSEWLPFVVMV